MSFDRNNADLIVQPQERAIKVNISLIAGVLIFLAIGVAAGVWIYAAHG